MAARQAYEQVGIRDPRKELDLAVVHDCFTITEMVIYEDLGFTGTMPSSADPVRLPRVY